MSFEDNGFTEVKNGNNPQGNQRQDWNNQSSGNSGGYSGNQGYRGNNSGSFNNRSSYPNNNGGGSGGGFRGNQGGYQKGNFQPRPQNRQDEGPVELYLPYVASGPRDTPPNVVAQIIAFIQELDERGYTLRNGGRDGAEDAFEKAAKRKEVHLPWKGFLDKDSKFTYTPDAAKILAAKFHPAFDGLKPVIQTFLATDVRMVMGKDLKAPALFLITWSEDGAETLQEKTAKTGNAGQAISVACALKIPVFNFGKQGSEARLRQYLGVKPNGQEPQPQQQPVQQPSNYSTGSNYGNH